MTSRTSFRLVSGAVILGAIAFAALGLSDPAPKSPFNWLQFPLLLGLGLSLFTVPQSIKARPRLFPVLGVSWVLGMLVELTLTIDGTGIGGVHPNTTSSFILAQGDYIPLALVMWWLSRQLSAGLRDLMWVTAGMALTEGLVFTGSLASPLTTGDVFGAVLVGCYLIALYMVYLVLPFRLVGVGRGERNTNLFLLLAAGFASAFAVRVFWGLIYSPLISWAFGISPT